MRIVWNNGYGYSAVKGNMSGVINYMSVCHEKMNMNAMSKTIKTWNERAYMQSKQNMPHFAKDSFANGSVAPWTSMLVWIRGHGSEVRDQRSEIRGHGSEVGDQRSVIRGQRSEVKDQRSEIRGQRSEVRDQRSETRDQRPEIPHRGLDGKR